MNRRTFAALQGAKIFSRRKFADCSCTQAPASFCTAATCTGSWRDRERSMSKTGEEDSCCLIQSATLQRPARASLPTQAGRNAATVLRLTATALVPARAEVEAWNRSSAGRSSLAPTSRLRAVIAFCSFFGNERNVRSDGKFAQKTPLNQDGLGCFAAFGRRWNLSRALFRLKEEKKRSIGSVS